MLPLKVWQQDKEEPHKANMSHFIFLAVNSDDILLVPSPTWSALIKAVSRRPKLFTTEKKPEQQGTPEIYNIKAHEMEDMNTE